MNKFLMIKQRINDMISELSAHEQIPSERAMEILMDASRMTIRKAITALEQDGFLYRKEGVGTFVAERRDDSFFTRSGYMAATHQEIKTNYVTKILSLKPLHVNARLAKVLDMPVGTLVTQLRRVRYKHHQPVMVDESYYVHAVTGDLTPEQCEISTLDSLEDQDIVAVHSGYYDFQATTPDAATKDLLQLDAFEPLLKIHRRMYSQKGDLIDVKFIWVRTNHVDIVIKTDVSP